MIATAFYQCALSILKGSTFYFICVCMHVCKKWSNIYIYIYHNIHSYISFKNVDDALYTCIYIYLFIYIEKWLLLAKWQLRILLLDVRSGGGNRIRTKVCNFSALCTFAIFDKEKQMKCVGKTVSVTFYLHSIIWYNIYTYILMYTWACSGFLLLQ